jgi:transcription initiation protein SPT3
MYTFGEVRHPLPETTALIEDITRSQMIELLIQVAGIARRRGSRHFNHEDLIFLIRRDRMKV